MGNIKISIIIPAYNAEKTIKKCLKSIVSQSYTNFEVFIINDGSSDHTLTICQQFSLDDRFKIINQDNSGVSKTRNRGICLATGEYICFVDSDDVLTDNYLSNYINVLNQDQNVDLILQGIDYYYEDKRQILKSFMGLDSYDFVDIFIYSEKNDLNYAPFNKLFNAKLIKENKLFFDENLSFGEDYLFVLDVYLKSKLISFSKKSGYIYVMDANPNSLSKKRLSFETLSHFASKVKNKREELFRNHLFPEDYIRYNNVDYSELLLRSIHEHYLSVKINTIDKYTVQDIFKKIPTDIKKSEFKHFDNKLIYRFKKQPIVIQYLLVVTINRLKDKLKFIYKWCKKN